VNLQALAAMDDCENATGKPLHMHEVTIPHPRTAKEIMANFFNDLCEGYDSYEYDNSLGYDLAADLTKALKDGGYDILERVSVYKK